MVAHRLPVVSAFSAGTAVDPLPHLGVDDVLAVLGLAGAAVDAFPDVLEERLLVPEVTAGLAIQLPQDAVLADGEDQVLAGGIHEHALEDDVEIERFARRVLEVPGQLAGVGVERHRGAGVERLVQRVHAAADRHPRLGLRGAPIRQVQFGVVAAGDPRLAAGAVDVRQRAPRVAARLAVLGHGVELPQLLAGGGVVAADEALLVLSTASSRPCPGSACPWRGAVRWSCRARRAWRRPMPRGPWLPRAPPGARC